MQNRKINIPEYPKIKHIPLNAVNLDSEDVISEDDVMWDNSMLAWNIEEKVDGANVGILFDGEYFRVRNRTRELRKGGNLKDTAANKQFRPIWNWCEDNRDLFKKLLEITHSDVVCVYGEWCYAAHGIIYDRIPDYFIAYESILYDHRLKWNSYWVMADRLLLEKVGFTMVPLLAQHATLKSWEDVLPYMDRISTFSTSEKQEGIVVKEVYNGFFHLNSKYKMVSSGFKRGVHWDTYKLTHQKRYIKRR